MFEGVLFGVTYHTWDSYKKAAEEAVSEGYMVKVGEGYYIMTQKGKERENEIIYNKKKFG